MQVHVKAHGVLRPQVPAGPRDLPDRARVADLVASLGYQGGGVWMILVNGANANRDLELHDGDRVELVPPLGGG